jgi:ELWxxDGT repeat protein
VRILTVLLAAACVAAPIRAQSAFRVANLNAGGVTGKVTPIYPSAEVGDRLVFSAFTAVGRSSIWSTDDTEAGLVQITDEVVTAEFAEMGGVLYFLSFPDLGPHGLWRTDGTREGTWLLHQFDRPVPIDSASSMVAVGNQLFFFGYDSEHGQELWKSDGTVPGTVFVAELTSGPSSSFVFQMVAFRDEVYFIAESESGFGLWRSDGVVTTRVADVGSYHGLLGATDRFVFFTVDDTELWRTDGTESGTIHLGSFVEDYTGPYFEQGPSGFLDLGGTALFVADDGATGQELWRSDGTVEGTGLVIDVNPGGAWGFASTFPPIRSGDRVYFPGDDGVHGRELWTSDGTAGGTRMVRDIRPGSDSALSAYQEIDAALGQVFFAADDGVHGLEPWRSDGTDQRTQLVDDIQPGAGGSYPYLFMVLDGSVYFVIGAEGATVLWRTDGTESGTAPFDRASRDAWSFPSSMTDFGGAAFFAASREPSTFDGLWKSDGTLDGTQQVRNFCNMLPDSLRVFRDDLYFIANDCATGQQVWNTHGLVKAIPSPFVRELVAAGDLLFYWNQFDELWRTDGTSDGTVQLLGANGPLEGVGPSVVALSNGLAFFAAADVGALRLWRTDGTPQGTVPLQMLDSLLSRPVVLRGRLLFAAMDGARPAIWTSIGTEAGTSLVLDFPSLNVAPLVFTVSGDLAYFVNHAAHELWRTDGTAAGTIRVAAFEATSLTDVNGILFFAGDDGVHGEELWTSDGTPEGTRMVRDIWPGPIGSSPTALRNVDGVLVFAAHDGVNGGEPWRSDGTKPGTYILADVNPGIGSSDPSDFARSGDLVFFRADDGETGLELWAIPASAISELSGPRRPPARVISPRR